MQPLPISATAARRLVLHLQAMTDPPRRKLTAPSLVDLITRLGFVQVDSVSRVERAHHMILFSRNQTYRPQQLRRPLERDAALFENWTHDASIIPTGFYAHWQLRFHRERDRLAQRYRVWQGEAYKAEIDGVMARLEAEGPLMSRDFTDSKKRGSAGWWNWHPGKAALEFLWRTGEVAVARREGFQKVYDLTHRVIPDQHRTADPDPATTIDWLCRAALQRLGFGSPGEIAGFWGHLSAEDAKAWCTSRLAAGDLVPVKVGAVDGSADRQLYALPDVEDRLGEVLPAPDRLRVINPFDPILRDRKRLNRLFGFDYRIEIFVPAAKRRYGYYIFPLLEGERLTGRVDLRADRDRDALFLERLWWEPKVRTSQARVRRLEAELDRLRRFTGLGRVVFSDEL